MLPLGAAVLGMQRVRWTVRDAGSVKRTREILCRKRLLRAGENYMSYFISKRQYRIEIWGAAILGFILGSAVGSFIYMAITAEQMKEFLAK